MNIYKNKFLSRFGLMHMIATNLCVWLNVLILETSHEILHGNLHHAPPPGKKDGEEGTTAATVDHNHHGDEEELLAHDEAIARHFRDTSKKIGGKL